MKRPVSQFPDRSMARLIAELREVGLIETTAAGITYLDPARLGDELWERALAHS